MSNILTINDNSTNLSVTIPAPVSNSQITVLEPTTAFIAYDRLASAGAGGGYVNIVTGDSRIIINKNNNEVNISFDDTGLLTSETLTTLSLVGNSLKYSDEEGDTTSIDLSSYLDDTNDFLNQASFDSSNGVLTLSVENQSDVTVNLDGRYLTSSSIGANVTDQYIPKYSDVDEGFVDSPSYVTSESVVVSTDNTDDTPAVNLYYNPQVEQAVTELTVAATEIPNVDDNSDNDLNKGFYYADNKYIYGGTATEPNINLVDTNTGVVTTLYDGTYLSDPEYDRFVYIAPDRFIALSFNIVDFGGSGLKPGISLFSFDGSSLNKLSTLEITDYIGGYIEVFYDSINDVIWALNGAGGFVKLIIDNDELSYVSSHTASDSRINLHQLDPVKILGENDGFIYIAVDDASEPQALFYKMQLTGSFVEPDFIVNTDVIKLGGNPYPSDLWEVTDPSLDKFSESIWFMTNAGGSSNFGEANLYRVDISTGVIHKPFSSSFDSSGVAQYDNHFGVLYVANTIYDSGSNTFTYTTAYDVDSDGSLTKIKEIGGDLAGEKRIFGTPYWGQTVINDVTGTIFNVDDQKHFSVSSPFYNQNTSSSNLYLDESTVKTKAELTYGAYSILESDSPVDPISFFGLNTDGAIYAAKSPDAVSHHWYTNEFDTGVYIKVMSLDEDGLIIYKASDETSAVVTKDSIDNWNYAYNNTVEALSFNSSTGVITATQLDGGTLTVDISALYDDTNTTYTVSTSDNVSSGIDVNLVGSDSTIDSINIIGKEDVTVTQSDNVISISAPHETTTSLSFDTDAAELTYNDEDGTANIVSLSSLIETVTSLSFTSETNTITYVDEDNTSTDLVLDVYDYNIELGLLSGNTIPVQLNDAAGGSSSVSIIGSTNVTIGNPAQNVISIASKDTTYDLNAGGTTNGTVTVTLTDGVNNDVIDIVGTNDVTVSQSSGTITIDAPHETTTSISFAGNDITYVDEDNASTVIDLSVYDYTINIGGIISSNQAQLELRNDIGLVSEVGIVGGANVTIGSPAQNVLSISSEDTTYDLLKIANTVSGVDVILDGSDGTLDVINFRGANAASVNLLSGNITVDVPHETTTSISLVNDEIIYIDEDNGTTTLSLLSYLDNTDTTYSVSTANAVSGANIVLTAGGSGSGTDSVSIVGGDNVTVTQASDVITVSAADETVTSLSIVGNDLIYVDESNQQTTINLSLYLDDTNLARLTSGTLNGTTGVATFTRDDATTFDLDLSALLDVNNYVDAVSFNTATGDLTLGRNGLADLTASLDGRYLTSAANDFLTGASFDTANGELTLGVDNQADVVVDLDGRYLTSAVDTNDYVTGASFNTGNGVLTLTVQNQSAVTVDLDNRYLTSYTETDTLDSVASRGNTTDQPIKIGEDGGDPLSELHVVGTLTIEGTDQNATIASTAMQVQINDNKTALTTAQKAFITAKTAQTFEDKQVSLVSSSDANGGVAAVFTADSSGYAYYANHLRMGGGTQGFVRYDVGKWSGTGTAYENISAAALEAFVVGRWESTGARTDIFKVSSSGTVTVDGTIYADAFQNNSSIRYKENVQDLEDFTEAVMAMRPVRYDIKKNGKNDIGFIAEEVNELVPEIVGKNKDDQVESMDYARLSVVLLQQVQKQQSLIEKLEERISKLESK